LIAYYLPLFEEAADVVYFEAAYVAAQCAAVLDQFGPKLVMCTGSDVRVMPELQPSLARLMPAVFAQMTRVLCRSDDLREWAVRRGAPAERTSVLHTAVDTTFFAPVDRPPRPGDALRLVTVGRFHWVKGYEYAVQAVALAREAGHDVTLTIVGPEKGEGDAVTYAVRDLGLDEVVTFPGEKSQAGIRAALARADGYLVSSLSEGISRAALEAMAMGVPVVTTDAGGMTEIVEDGVEGLVVPRRDPRALADAIIGLAADPAMRAAMGKRARARAEQFDTSHHLDELEQVLLDLPTRPEG
jgi:glycosyltransferase involved in cell wall biosynthesis